MLITCPKCSVKYQIPDEVRLSEGKKLKCSNCMHVFTFSTETEPAVDQPVVSEEPQEKAVENEPNPAEDKVFSDGPVFQDEVPQAFVPVESTEKEPKHPIGMFGAVLSFCILVVLLVFGFLYRDVLLDKVVSIPNTGRSNFVKEALKPEIQRENTVVPELKEHPVPREEYVVENPEIVVLPQISSVRFEKRLDPIPTIRIEGVLKNMSSVTIKLPEKVRAIAYDQEGAVLFEKDIFLTDLVLPAGEERLFFGSYQPAPDGVQWVDVTF
ncbi:MAG: zinc-ribbon domain-containing protein [Alphaproteobacteria bacterium]|nr:zinc-ribbon domain-containing protein [Alphaproteobacteria bacterium]